MGKGWGDFDLAGYKWVKKSMMGEPDEYFNGKRYDPEVPVKKEFFTATTLFSRRKNEESW